MADRRRVLMSVEGVTLTEVRQLGGAVGVPETSYAVRSPRFEMVISLSSLAQAETWCERELREVRAGQ